MKKILLLSGICLAVAVFSCNQSGTKNKATSTASKGQSNDSLLILAKTFFKPLPPVAENRANPVTAAKVHLGKVLYYDTRLSKSGKISCNSCHELSNFGVDNEPTSTGEGGQKGNRNSPTVFNAALQNMQFWDGRAKDVEEQAGMPILNPVEMAIPHKQFLVDRLAGIPLYEDLFKKAFPQESKPLTYDNLQKAIGAFERTLLTPSRFDKYMQGDRNALTSKEKEGLSVFINTGCPSCHHGVAVGGSTLQRFGIVTDYRSLTKSKINDEGRETVTKKPADKDVFKVASLRNVAGTFPYFHNGSVFSLDSAIRIMGKAQLNKDLSKQQVEQIIAFLNTLTGDIDPAAKTFPAELAKK
jgi:cytochrome c peroxidase